MLHLFFECFHLQNLEMLETLEMLSHRLALFRGYLLLLVQTFLRSSFIFNLIMLYLLPPFVIVLAHDLKGLHLSFRVFVN